jgi:predicted transcriptional regulator
MKSRRIASIDQDTGEVLEGVVVYCGVKQNPYSKGWVMNSQEALELLATDKDLKGETYRVLLLLLSRLDFENWIQVTQTEISEKLEMKKPNVSKAVSILEEKGIILRGPKIGRTYAFRLNPYFGWKGKVKNLNDYRREEEDRDRREFRERHLKAVESTTSSDDSE